MFEGVYMDMNMDVGYVGIVYDVHLLSAEDQSLLDRGDAFFLLNSFLYSGDLYWFSEGAFFENGWLFRGIIRSADQGSR